MSPVPMADITFLILMTRHPSDQAFKFLIPLTSISGGNLAGIVISAERDQDACLHCLCVDLLALLCSFR